MYGRKITRRIFRSDRGIVKLKLKKTFVGLVERESKREREGEMGIENTVCFFFHYIMSPIFAV